jgi:hypothetical protein
MSSHFSYVRIGEIYLKKCCSYDFNVYQLNMICIKIVNDRPRGKDIVVLLYFQLTFQFSLPQRIVVTISL